MFTKTGMPQGYDQIAPGRDLPKISAQPAGQQPLQQAITNPVGAPQNPPDPSMQRWRNGPTNQPAGAQQQLANFSTGMNPGDVNSLVGQYFNAAGVQHGDTNYWDGAWSQWGQNDPNYFRTRLLNGIAQDNHGNMSAFGAPSATAAGGWGPGTAGWSAPHSGGNNAALMAALLRRQQQQPTQPADPYGSLLSYMNQVTQQA